MEKRVSSTLESVSESNTKRYERKFIYENWTPEDLIDMVVLTNSFCFSEVFERRTVNNIYYDDQSMSFYHQNVAGDQQRSKYRLRWYGDAFEDIKKPVLEVKKKNGTVGTKLSFPLKDSVYNLLEEVPSVTQLKIHQDIVANNNPEVALKLSNLSPSLYNSYERRYFLSDCKNFRITVDYNMAFYNPSFNDYRASKTRLSDVVLELKYKVGDDSESRKLTQVLSSRLSKNSKYVRGMNLIHHHTDG